MASLHDQVLTHGHEDPAMHRIDLHKQTGKFIKKHQGHEYILLGRKVAIHGNEDREKSRKTERTTYKAQI